MTKSDKTFFFESWYETGITFLENIFDYRKKTNFTHSMINTSLRYLNTRLHEI